MKKHMERRNYPSGSNLHPAVGFGLIACVAWIVAMIWLGFHENTETALNTGIVAVFAVVFLGVPFCLWRFSQIHKPHEISSLRRWLNTEFETHAGSMPAREAALLILLVPAVCACMFTMFSFFELLTSNGII